MVVDPTYSIDTGLVFSMRSESEYAPVNKNDNYANVIGYLNSYSKYFDCCDTPVTVEFFDEFLDARGSPFSSVQVTFESTNVVVDHIDKLLDTRGSPFSLVYPRPSSICQTHVNAFLGQMVYYYCTTITESFL